jgi:hypothetical protein
VQPINLSHRSIMRITTVGTVAASIAIVVLVPNLNRPALLNNSIRSTNENSVVHHSIAESQEIVSEAAPLMIHCSHQFPGGWYPLKNACLSEVLNCAIKLAPSGDPSAEYIVGWMFENGFSGTADGINVIFVKTLEAASESNHTAEANEAATEWYHRAQAHGSADAPLALGRLIEFSSSNPKPKKEIISLYEEAIARGNDDAKIELGRCYQDLNTALDGKKAMELFEKASKAKSVYTVDSAVIQILSLWKSNRAVPSAEFSRGKTSAFDFLSAFDSKLDQHRFDNFFTVGGCTPDVYGQYRAEILPKVRHSLSLSSDDPAARVVS